MSNRESALAGLLVKLQRTGYLCIRYTNPRSAWYIERLQGEENVEFEPFDGGCHFAYRYT